MTETRARYAPHAAHAAARTTPPALADVAAVFEALSHEARRHLVLLLGTLGGELSSGYLAARFQHSWPTTTRHLKVLEQAGIVEVRREGRGSHYRLDRERLRAVVGGWLAHVEPVNPELTWPSTGPKTSEELAAVATDLPKRIAAGATDLPKRIAAGATDIPKRTAVQPTATKTKRSKGPDR